MKRKQERFADNHPLITDYKKEKPWETVFRDATDSHEYWSTTLTEPAMVYMNSRGLHGIPGPSSARERGRISGKREWPQSFPELAAAGPIRRQGRMIRDYTGNEICLSFKRGSCKGCRRAHVCEFCLGDHRWDDRVCPQSKAFQKGYGKGKNKTRRGHQGGKSQSKQNKDNNKAAGKTSDVQRNRNLRRSLARVRRFNIQRTGHRLKQQQSRKSASDGIHNTHSAKSSEFAGRPQKMHALPESPCTASASFATMTNGIQTVRPSVSSEAAYRQQNVHASPGSLCIASEAIASVKSQFRTSKVPVVQSSTDEQGPHGASGSASVAIGRIDPDAAKRIAIFLNVSPSKQEVSMDVRTRRHPCCMYTFKHLAEASKHAEHNPVRHTLRSYSMGSRRNKRRSLHRSRMGLPDCRTAHRAGAPWSFSILGRIQPDDAVDRVRRLRYVLEIEAGGHQKYGWLAFEAVNVSNLSQRNVVEQIIHRDVNTPQADGVKWLTQDYDPHSLDASTKKQRKDMESQSAIGGLRSPHLSVQHLPNHRRVGDKLKAIIDAEVDKNWVAANEALDTIGTGLLPPLLQDIATICRNKAYEIFDMPDKGRTGLQGPLIQKIAKAMGDPDQPAQGWMKRMELPLGI